MVQPALMVFAKQPVAGKVKTRLQPRYTPQQAAEIAAFLIRETVALCASSWPGAVYLCGAPDAEHALFRELSRRFHVPLLEQGEGDLGERMRRALAYGIERHGAAAIFGCDVPHCRWEILDEANALLARGINVLGPSEDGGYYLIGMTTAPAELFRDMPWGAAAVLVATLERARSIGLEFTLLPSLRDIDSAADLWLVAQEHESLRRFL